MSRSHHLVVLLWALALVDACAHLSLRTAIAVAEPIRQAHQRTVAQPETAQDGRMQWTESSRLLLQASPSPSAGGIVFTQQVVSDTQVWWYRGDRRLDSDPRKADAVRTNAMLRDSIKAEILRAGDASAGLVINGDLTSYGHEEEWLAYDQAWEFSGKQGSPWLRNKLYQGLGNHDIANNYGDCYHWLGIQYYGDMPTCALGASACCSASMLTIQLRMLERGPPEGYISHSNSGAAYSWQRDHFRFVMLNMHPYLTQEAAMNANWKPTFGPYMDWFETQLKEAAAARQFIVVFIHSLQYTDGNEMFRKSLYEDAEFRRLVREYPVSVIFQGHNHEVFGQWAVVEGVPVVWSGAAEYLSYVDVGYGLNVIDVKLKVATENGGNMVVDGWRYELNQGTGKAVWLDFVGHMWRFDSKNFDSHLPARVVGPQVPG